MTGLIVPPAQAEALFDTHNGYDAQDDLRDDYLTDLSRCDRAGQPWRDDDDSDFPVLSDPLKGRLPRSAPSFGPAR